MKHVFLILHGAADTPLADLEGKTPLEAAQTPRLDDMARRGRVGAVHTLPADGEPRTELALLGLMGYPPAEIDTPGGDDDDDDIGVRFRGGLRFQANEQIELAGGVSLATIFDEDVGLDARALYAFNEKISGFVGFEIWDDSFAMIGVRFPEVASRLRISRVASRPSITGICTSIRMTSNPAADDVH